MICTWILQVKLINSLYLYWIVYILFNCCSGRIIKDESFFVFDVAFSIA